MKMTRIGFAVALLAATSGLQAQTMTSRGGTTVRTPVADGSTRVYIVQLAEAPAAVYTGNVPGFAATKPAKGTRLNSKSANVTSYVAHLEQSRSAVLSRLGGQVKAIHTYNTAFNGFAAVLSSTQAAQLMKDPGVVSVVPSEVRQLDTTRTPGMLGEDKAGGIWSQLDALSRLVKGENVIVAHIDTGFWPENPNFGDRLDAAGKPVPYNGVGGTLVYDAPPAKWHGTCVTGEGFTANMCNNKVIGARYYNADFLASGAILTAQEFTSPRDGDGHGSHTASTSSGNSNVAIVNASGVTTAIMSGIAPRARLAIYKVCWTATTTAATGCYTADTLHAVDDAVADGVDVINFSVSGTANNYTDPVEIAYLNATTAGVFVAAAAGNEGPGANTVKHIGPWLTTVASGTVDRAAGGGDLNLGNGTLFSGFSLNFFGATNGNLVLANNIPAAGQTAANANICAANSLDPASAAGKIVVCDRSATNTAAVRIAESAEVKRVGGIGMILLNPDSATPVADAHTVPTVQLATASRTAVRDYTVTAGASGTIGLSYNRPGVTIAPVVSSFSSRGPGLADNNVMKPDLMAPGSSIVAGYKASLSQAQHDQLIAGTFTAPSATGTISGTSMATPHIAGAAALLRQLYPNWSPAAVKSALMTSTTPVLLSSGAADPVRWNYGAGHLNPNGSAIPSLVYDVDLSDYGRFLCGEGLAPPVGLGKCDTLGSVKSWNLNLASLQADGVAGSRTLTRKVTNVSAATRTYIANASLAGWNVAVTPSSLTLAPGASASFDVKVTRTSSAIGTWVFGNLGWSDGVVSINSPLSARYVALSAPVQVNDVRASGKGTKIVTAESGYSGGLSVTAVGLVPASVTTNTITTGQTQCIPFVVPAGVSFARAQLFQSDTGGATTDLDMDVFRSANCTGTNVGTSAGGSSDEVVTLESPTAATYSVRVTGFATPAGGALYKLSTWVVGPATGTQTLQAAVPGSVYGSGALSIGTSWNVTPGSRYMGVLNFFDSAQTLVASSKMLIDNR